MAITKSKYVLGDPMMRGAAALTYSLNATNLKIAAVYQARSTTPIRYLGVAVYQHVGTKPVYRISIQGVNASKEPDGTVKSGSGSNDCYINATLPIAINQMHWIDLGVDHTYTTTVGEYFSVVLEHVSGEPPTAGNYAKVYQGVSVAHEHDIPYMCRNTGAAWTLYDKYMPCLCAKDTSGVINGGITAGRISSQNVATNQTFIEIASVWTPDRDTEVSGFFAWVSSSATAKFYAYLREEGNDTPKRTILYDPTLAMGGGGEKGKFIQWEPYTLTGGQQYLFSIKGFDTTALSVYYFSFHDAADCRFLMGPLLGNFRETSSGWGTPTTNYGSMIWPYITGEDQSSGGGGEGIILGSGSG